MRHVTPMVSIGERKVGPGADCLIVAEIGVNHNGDVSLALQMVDAAKVAGADAVKFQAFMAERLVTPDAEKARYQVETTGTAGRQLEMLKALELSAEDHRVIKEYAESEGLLYLCTPYDSDSADLLEVLRVEAVKIASTDVTNTPLLRHIAAKHIPMLVSTGMATLGEVERAVGAVRMHGTDLVLLQCTSDYPAPVEEANLRAIPAMEAALGCPVGYSDHTQGVGVSPWAVALGACVVEKHFTIDRSLPGPDQRASLEPVEFAELVKAVRQLEAALGDGVKRPTPSELPNKVIMQKSLVARVPIRKGELFSAKNLEARRPATGLPPHYQDRLVHCTAARDIKAGEILTHCDVDWSDD